MPIGAIALIWLVPIVRNQVQGQLQAVALGVLGFMCLGWMFGHLGFLVDSPHAYAYLAFVVFAVEVSDISAFIVENVGAASFSEQYQPEEDLGRGNRCTGGGNGAAVGTGVFVSASLRLAVKSGYRPDRGDWGTAWGSDHQHYQAGRGD